LKAKVRDLSPVSWPILLGKVPAKELWSMYSLKSFDMNQRPEGRAPDRRLDATLKEVRAFRDPTWAGSVLVKRLFPS